MTVNFSGTFAVYKDFVDHPDRGVRQAEAVRANATKPQVLAAIRSLPDNVHLSYNVEYTDSGRGGRDEITLLTQPPSDDIVNHHDYDLLREGKNGGGFEVKRKPKENLEAFITRAVEQAKGLLKTNSDAETQAADAAREAERLAAQQAKLAERGKAATEIVV